LTETKPLADLNSMHRKPATDEFLKTVEDVLKAQRDRMMEFPYLSFPLAFKGTTEQKVGYAWNSLCCSFYCSLVQKDCHFHWHSKALQSKKSAMHGTLYAAPSIAAWCRRIHFRSLIMIWQKQHI